MTLFTELTALEQAAAAFGFKWETVKQILEQIRQECNEVEELMRETNKNPLALQQEIGDILHAAFSLCVFCGFNAEETLQLSVEKFRRRFEIMKRIAASQGLADLNGQPFSELMKLWNAAKKDDV